MHVIACTIDDPDPAAKVFLELHLYVRVKFWLKLRQDE